VIGPGNVKGILPTKNFQKTTFEEIEQIDGEGLLKTIYAGKRACPGCPIGCRRVVKGGGLISGDLSGLQWPSV
jgi:aldehyde:ferredoxin oxidoreductase